MCLFMVLSAIPRGGKCPNPWATALIDHMQYLGNTLQEIAREKAGIIKEGIPVVTAAQHVALKELKKDAHNKKARIYFYGRDFEIDTRNKWEQGQVVVVKRKGMPKELEKSMLFVPFIGAHQAVNAAVAAMALTILMKEDGRINENDQLIDLYI